ncbi:hypothetical protein [Francisella sp. SYW-9]|uniref:hypothetical protein n=1 Tax=Francisella sp. SYW-9 TaxID=2610888 RepID=UPI00123D35B5|nr:hypothetical protein [Francisella sp. SYW-9]
MRKFKYILATMALATPIVSLAADYAALEKELKTAESNSQSNYGGGTSAMQGGFDQQKQQNIGRSIYDQNRGVSERQQGNNIKTTYFGDQQGQQNSSRSIYEQNRENSQVQQGYNQENNIRTTSFEGQ